MIVVPGGRRGKAIPIFGSGVRDEGVSQKWIVRKRKELRVNGVKVRSETADTHCDFTDDQRGKCSA